MRVLLVLLLFLWYIFSSYWYVCQIRENNCDAINKVLFFWKDGAATNNQIVNKPSPPPPAPEPEEKEPASASDTPALSISPLKIVDGSTTVVNNESNFVYKKSADQYDADPAMQQSFRQIAGYMKSNTDKVLDITGLYDQGEEYKGAQRNLGFARADHAKKQLLAMGVPANRITTNSRINRLAFSGDQFSGGLDFGFKADPKAVAKSAAVDSSANKPAAADSAAAKKELAVPLPTFIVRDGKDTVINSGTNFRFAPSSEKAIMSSALNKDLRGVSNYLKKNKDRELEIVGAYSGDEENNTSFPNLGVARAEGIKSRVTATGVKADRVKTKGKRNNGLKKDGNNIVGGVDFNFSVTKKLAEALKTKNKLLYFDTGNASLNVTPELQKYFKDVKTYLEQSPQSKLQLTGHTDNVGDAAQNKKLGLNRANFVKNELAKINIDQKRVSTKSEGQAKPIADNKTDAGRKKNRRVEMIILDK